MRVNLSTLAFDLPEDIKSLKAVGDFDRLKAVLDARIASPRTSKMLRDRLIVERELLPRWERRFPHNRARAIEIMQKRVKDFTEAEFDALEADGCMDFIYIRGEKRYVSSFAGTLCKMLPELSARQFEQPDLTEKRMLDEYRAEIKAKGEVKYAFTIKSSLRLEDGSFENGETYMVHFPVPAPAAQQPADAIKVVTDGTVAAPDAFQRTVYWQMKLDENRAFEAESSFVSHLKYVDPFKDAPRIVYPDALPVCEDDLSEQFPHIVFTPYLKALAREIVGDETRPLYQAKLIYDYITLNVRYSFMRSYILVDRHAEYCALNMKGDCGIQAILFITLCRILGIPARWQSGWTVDKESTGDHDWAQFWTEEFGWLFADPSYGGGAKRTNDEEKRNFYFGNLDPFRMIANRRYQTPYELPKQFENYDPYDNQDGEVETTTRGFVNWEYDKTDVTVRFEKLS